MESNYISLNLPNIITVGIMLFLFWTFSGVVYGLIHRQA
jgi:hypothetical protein